jgi:CheY-like chemotaxis protein/anti-sigma regulatory factor (Ser/Thr protein kinase)
MNQVLVIDDEPEIRDLVRSILSKKGVEVRTASTGEEAVEILDRQIPDVVITDVHMPGMNGLDLIRFLNENHPKIPVIVITSFGSYSVAVEALNQGAFYFIPKPFRPADLAKTVQKAFRLPRISSERMRAVPFVSHSISMTIPGDPGLIDGVTFQLVTAAEAMGYPQKTLTLRIPIAADELLANAVFHGCRGNPEKRVHVRAVVDHRRFRFTLRDEGEGFDWRERIRSLDLPQRLEDSGRGILIARHYLDSLTYHGKGNKVEGILFNGPPR